MASIGSQKINATQGRTEEAQTRYRMIGSIIRTNSLAPFEDVIASCAGISKGTWYNYISPNGKQSGRVSQYTVANLSDFFGLPQGIFNCSLPFDDQAKEKIATVIRENFGAPNSPDESSGEPALPSCVLEEIQDILVSLNNERNIAVLRDAKSLLEKAVKITEKKLEIESLLGNE